MCDDQTSLKQDAHPDSSKCGISHEAPQTLEKSVTDDEHVELDFPGYNARHYPPESNEVMSYSMFDDNGNPMDEQDFKDESEVDDEKQLNYAQMHQQQLEEATFFINAAAVSDEEDGAVYMAGSRSGDIIGLGPVTITQDDASKPNERTNEDEESSILFKRIKHRSSRVPISRSFPDIIQTTMTEKLYGINPNPRNGTDKESFKSAILKNELVLADSLEELADTKPQSPHTQSEDNNDPEHPVKKLEPRFSLEGSTSQLSSSMAGISCEKPPDSWTIDFNSLSIEDTFSEAEPKSSNSNSLAYFLDIKEAIPATDAGAAKHVEDDPKKIFSLFIDIGDKKQLQNDQRNAMNTSYYVEKKTPNAVGHKTTTGKSSSSGKYNRSGEKDYMGMSTVSNRSSLHVATHDLEDTMFSSSILSSMEASGTDEDMDSCLKLGMDLLRMFQEGINTDVQISVNGRTIRAHKCILASRSQYFAAVLSGNAIKKTGNNINLDDYSYSVVQFTLYHIYSGTNEIPDSIDVIELISLTDLLGLEGLKEIISNTIKAKFAHNFHRPCSTCIIGVIQFYPIVISYGMEDLSRKMTKWMSKHFVRIWPTKAFASLGDDLIEKCLSYTINHLSGENLIDITLGCDQLLNTMPNIKWAETIFKIVSQLTQACVEFIGQDFCEVLQSQRFLVFGKGQAWNISRIENTFLDGLQLLKPDDACLSHVCLTRLIELGTETFDEAFVDFLIMLQREVEKYLLANASRAVLSKNWERLSEVTRKKICSTGFLGHDKSGSKSQSSKNATASKKLASNRTESKPTRPTSSTTKPAAPTSWKTGQKLAESQILDSTSGAKPRQILSPTEKGAKVASVRPMPSQSVQHQNVFSSRQNTKSTAHDSRAKSPGTSRLASKPLSQHKSGQSFESSPASSSSSKPVTPVTPSRPNSFPYRNTKLPPRLDDKPTTPTKPVFLTNSEKAKAVSKPALKMRSARSNSLSNNNPNQQVSASATVSASHSRQSSVGSVVVAAQAATAAQPRTPNLSQPSRYATSLTGARRNPVEKVTQSVSAMPKSPAPAPKGRVNSANAARRTPPTAPSNSSKSAPNSSRQAESKSKASGSNTNKPGRKPLLDFDSGSECDSLMTKSNIEDVAPNTEPKVRTLAEIGRSNTFSKDEPTVIGKMDFGLDVNYTQL